MSLDKTTLTGLLVATLLAGGVPLRSEAKSYSSGGGHSYSSHSSSSGGSHSGSFSSGSSRSSSGGGSHSSSSFSSGGKSSVTTTSRSSSPGSSGSKSFSSGSGKSYSSGSTSAGDSRHGYSSAKSYSAGSGKVFTHDSRPGFQPAAPHDSGAGFQPASPGVSPAKPPSAVANSASRQESHASSPSGLTFDAPAARARKEEASRQEFTRFKEASSPSPRVTDATAPSGASPSYRVTPPPLPPSATGNYRRPVYVPDAETIWTRRSRGYTVFYPYVSRPVVVYRDPYNSFFWWWLLDRTLDDRATWAYHHRYDMDPARYQALVADNQQLGERVAQLEAQQVPRDPNYTPPGIQKDLMYSDQHVTQAYTNRPTPSGRIAFWAVAIPLALGAGYFFIWLIFLKRWQPATA